VSFVFHFVVVFGLLLPSSWYTNRSKPPYHIMKTFNLLGIGQRVARDAMGAEAAAVVISRPSTYFLQQAGVGAQAVRINFRGTT
jgi:hypothetical protein